MSRVVSSEEIRESQRLKAEGRTREEISRRLGVSKSTISLWVKARPCADCDSLIVSSRAERCSPCANRYAADNYWTPERVTSAIVSFFIEHGRAPTSNDWKRTNGKHPARNQVAGRFGTFNAAVRAAGLTPRKVGERRAGRGPQLRRLTVSVSNGYTREEELAQLIADQEHDAHTRQLYSYSLDALADWYRSRSGLSYSDGWTNAVCTVVDRRRQIDAWAEADTAEDVA